MDATAAKTYREIIKDMMRNVNSICPFSGEALDLDNTVVIIGGSGAHHICSAAWWHNVGDGFISAVKAARLAGRIPATYQATILDGSVFFSPTGRARRAALVDAPII